MGRGEMGGVAEVLRNQLELLAEVDARRDEIISACLRIARELEAADLEGAAQLLKLAEAIGTREQADHGRLILALAQIDRVKAGRGGLSAWVATHLDATDGRARAIAESARRIGAIPELAEPLASGRIGTETARVLTRTAKAATGTGLDTATAVAKTLATAETEGVTAARQQVRALEHTLHPDTERELIPRQRARSFLRTAELENGMCRIEILLDAVRATTLRSAIDLQTSDWIRQTQYDQARPLPDDVRTTEQINVQALVHLAEIFHNAPAKLRQARFTPPMLYYTPRKKDPAGLTETVYGTLVPQHAIESPEVHLLELDDDGIPIALDGVKIDTNPHTRLATPPQRTALAYRDRHCSHPGCSRPTTYALHAHHKIPFSNGGPTTTRNMTLLCGEHHALTHQQHKHQQLPER
jgi:hypothetical protein